MKNFIRPFLWPLVALLSLAPISNAATGTKDLPPLRYISLDAGALLEFVPILLLEKIEADSGRPLVDLVDGFLGTSSGGIVAAALSNSLELPESRLRTEAIKNSYSSNATKAFSLRAFLNALYTWLGWDTWTDYETAATYLEDLLKEQFGNTYLSHALTHLMITTYDTNQGGIWLFDSHGALTDPAQDLPLWQTVRATTALEFMFGPATVQFNATEPLPGFIDPGRRGVIDPTPFLCQKLFLKYPNRKIIVYSLGTGMHTSPKTMEYVKGFRPNIEVIRLQPDFSDRDGTLVRSILNYAMDSNKQGALLDMNYLAAIPLSSYIDYIKDHAAPLMNTPEYKRMYEDLTGLEFKPETQLPKLPRLKDEL